MHQPHVNPARAAIRLSQHIKQKDTQDHSTIWEEKQFLTDRH